MPATVFTICGVKIHTFAKTRILCNATAGRERDPRKTAIHGLKEVRPPAAADLHPQEEASAEAQARTGVPAVHLIKMATANHAPAGHLKKIREANARPANPTKEVATTSVLPVDRTTGAAMANALPANPTKEVVTASVRPVVRSTGVAMANARPVNPTKEVVTASVRPVVRTTGAAMANARPANLMKEVVMVKEHHVKTMKEHQTAGAVTTVSLLKRTIREANPVLQALMEACV